MKTFAINIFYTNVVYNSEDGYNFPQCILINAKDEDDANRILNEYLESYSLIEYISKPVLINTTSKGIVFKSKSCSDGRA